jgi:hypothetical protein
VRWALALGVGEAVVVNAAVDRAIVVWYRTGREDWTGWKFCGVDDDDWIRLKFP